MPGRGYVTVLPTDVPSDAGSPPRLWSLGHKRMFEGVSGLQGASKLRLTALSSFGSARPAIRRVALYDMARRGHCLAEQEATSIK